MRPLGPLARSPLTVRLAIVPALLLVVLLVRVGQARQAAPAAAVPAGVHTASFRSAALRGTIGYSVYVPRGYARTKRRYPVVYLLHGLPDDGSGFRDRRVGELGAIAERRGRPVIVVAPQGARRGDTDPEWHDWGPGRNWETATSNELVGVIDSRYRTIADGRARALIGISAGGYGAALIGLHHPETYAVIESWSGYFHPTNPNGDAPLDVGSDRDNEVAGARAYVGCLAKMDSADRPRLLGFFVGDRDDRFLPENRRLDGELTAAGVPHLFRVYPGAHDDGFWDGHEASWLMAGVSRLARTVPADGRDPAMVRDRARGDGCPLT